MGYSLTAIFACLTLVNFVDRDSIDADTQVIYQPSTTVSVISAAELIFILCIAVSSHIFRY